MSIAIIRVKKDSEGPGTFAEWFANNVGQAGDRGDFGAPTVSYGAVALAITKRQSYHPFDDGVTLPAACGVINSVAVTATLDLGPAPVGSIKLFMYSGGVEQDDAVRGVSGAYSYTLALNPFTGLPWTRADVFSVEYGIKSITLGHTGYVAALSGGIGWGMEVTVDYTPPSFTAIAPARGSTDGGTSVTLTGTGFSGGGLTGVTFAGNAATGIVVLSDTSATCLTPTHAVGAVDVIATVSGTPLTLVAAYTYTIGAPRPTSDGELRLPSLDIAAISDAVASGDPSRSALVLRDAFTSLQRAMGELAFDLSTAIKRVRWITVPFSAAFFTAETPDGGVWTVGAANQIAFEYVRIADMLFVQVFLENTSTLAGKTYTSLYIKIPGGYRTQAGMIHSGPCAIITPGAVNEEIGLVEVDGTGGAQPVDKIRIRRLPRGTNVPAGLAATLALQFTIWFRIVPPPVAQ